MGPIAHMLPDGKRLHLNHGPIDLIIEADGHPHEIKRAYAAAEARFATVLDELVAELPLLRSEISAQGVQLKGRIAITMERFTRPHWTFRVTPMVAVAGAVADDILAAMVAQADLDRAYVNNGGDIALHLEGDEVFTIASAGGPITVRSEHQVRGIATSGWRGRSFSLGIADSVTVLARSAAEADVAATLIANAVDLAGSPKIKRLPAHVIAPDSDLRDRLVTIDVLPLDEDEIAAALASGVDAAEDFLHRNYISAASLLLGNSVRRVGPSMKLPTTKNHPEDVHYA